MNGKSRRNQAYGERRIWGIGRNRINGREGGEERRWWKGENRGGRKKEGGTRLRRKRGFREEGKSE